MSDNENPNRFGPEKQKKAIAWLDEKWPIEKRGCEICGSKVWSISTDFITPLIFEGNIHLGGRAYPCVGVICQNCGNTKCFNAVKMGLLEEVRGG